ncbi:alpha/beta-hydrolase family protein [Rhodococcus sp. G-MC3]|uniref:alpha/beta hydrolase n=1 Tax=Rhodococcus sp. G-MC3 TaxID=3046209 RepID=UPI0024B90BD7|nr:alpha/beta-hydrolase family protein [Rhodococcus sp. G-MC3]MDJ0393688.1 alpha/beta-hydrolase family protein [Rhodococcus sp. G-MC3]
MHYLRLFARRLEPGGLFLAVVFFALSMTPSLLPRTWYLQGVATGISIVTGYGFGCLVIWIAHLCGVRPRWSEDTKRFGWWTLAVTAVVVIPLFLIFGSRWQEIVRRLVEVDVEGPGRVLYLAVLLVALVVAVLLLSAARGLRWCARRLVALLTRLLPIPAAKAIGVAVVALITLFLINGAVNRVLIAAIASSSEIADKGSHAGVEQPTAPENSGSPESNEKWDSLGMEGRRFVSSGPSADDIEAFTGEPALTPIRAYVGAARADSIDEAADRVVAELRRTGAFDREIIAVATTTGRGWVNEVVAGSLEYMYGGDTAIASMQYSFLPSPIAFLADRDSPREAGRALFDRVYDAVQDLPEESRPKLVAFGESLGAYGGQDAFGGGPDMVARTDGALWVGNPNFTKQWSEITADRDAGSREILPVVSDGRYVRFAGRPVELELGTPWGETRVVYWQHASDPIIWWSPNLILHQPDWLREERGVDVDPRVRWFPFVTFWQTTFDMVFSTDVPQGYGHNYGEDAVDLWAEILRPDGWTAEDSARLRDIVAG